MPFVSEFRLFQVCLDPEKKQTMLKALDNQLELLEKVQKYANIIKRDDYSKEKWLIIVRKNG